MSLTPQPRAPAVVWSPLWPRAPNPGPSSPLLTPPQHRQQGSTPRRTGTTETVCSALSLNLCVLKLYVCLSSPGVTRGSTRLQARTVIQQCCRAKVKTKPALDGTDAQWAEVSVGPPPSAA